jgi:hypothetical protein
VAAPLLLLLALPHGEVARRADEVVDAAPHLRSQCAADARHADEEAPPMELYDRRPERTTRRSRFEPTAFPARCSLCVLSFVLSSHLLCMHMRILRCPCFLLHCCRPLL